MLARSGAHAALWARPGTKTTMTSRGADCAPPRASYARETARPGSVADQRTARRERPRRAIGKPVRASLVGPADR